MDADASPGRIGYGAANLGNLYRELSDEDAWELLETAWDEGIRYFDTAPHYGLGLSERRLGAFLQTKPRSEFIVSTKAGRLIRPDPRYDGGLDTDNGFHVRASHRRIWDLSRTGVLTSLDDSCVRLGFDPDIVFVHDPEHHSLEQAISDAFPALEHARDDGAVRGVGIGSMDNTSLERSVREARLDVIMIAGRYTLLDDGARHGVLPACRERGTKAVAASVFNSGLLAADDPSRDARFEYGALPEGLWGRLQAILGVCRNHGVRLPAAALQFPLRDPAIVSVVVAASRPAQLRENVALLSAEIPVEFWVELDAERRTGLTAERPGPRPGSGCDEDLLPSKH
ncbi:aldo/keto reductase [Microbacterium sp. NPDC056052]|uniref:aldo/keto reductase n=1 Tax=Microbacterium sp. NPDC056052 TaxID=3345695 RepID=UPI0035D859A9